MFYSISRLFIYSLTFLMLIAFNASPAFAQTDDFLWKWSKARGAGTIPALTCHDGRDKVGEFCYDKCKSGYHVNGTNKLRCTPPAPGELHTKLGEGSLRIYMGSVKVTDPRLVGCVTHTALMAIKEMILRSLAVKGSPKAMTESRSRRKILVLAIRF